jgi:hypothetical protein
MLGSSDVLGTSDAFGIFSNKFDDLDEEELYHFQVRNMRLHK